MASAHWKHPDTGTVDHVQPLAPGANYQNPARLHLANYTTNYNHRGFNGPQNLEAYLLLQGWTLGTFTDSRRGCGLGNCTCGWSAGTPVGCARRTAQPSYLGKYSSCDPVFRSTRAGQLFKSSGSLAQALTRTIACQRPNYFSCLFVERPHETKTASNLPCKFGD